jgi:polyisoprenoid-binding protein YceI
MVKKMLPVLAIAILLLAVGALFRDATAAAPPPAAASAKKPATASLPPADTYKIDPDHTFAYFGAWHHVVGLVRGRFDKVNGTITVSPDPAACSLDISIDTASISTQNSQRDQDLRGPDFFDAQHFPAMTYHGRGIRHLSGDSWIMDGSLTIRGVTKVVPLTFTFNGVFPDTKPGKPVRAAFHASAAARRGDFGMTRDNLMELGVPPAPGSDVSIEIDVEANAQNLRK